MSLNDVRDAEKYVRHVLVRGWVHVHVSGPGWLGPGGQGNDTKAPFRAE